MSKAFTKETEEDLSIEDDRDDSADDKLPVGQKNYMTPGCAERLRAELKTLLTETRPEVVRTVSWAASNGDRSENGDYIYGKKRLREIDRRIRFLTRRLDSASIVDPLDQAKGPNANRALFGATILVLHEDGKKREYSIVGIDEAAPASGKVSWISPIAKTLLNSQAGDVVTLRSPRGEEELEILAVRYVAIS